MDEVVLVRLVRLNAAIVGVVVGLLFASGVLVATLWLVIKGGKEVGPHLILLAQFFPGYEVTYVGSLIGFGYAGVVGFVVGYVASRIYNGIALRRERALEKKID